MACQITHEGVITIIIKAPDFETCMKTLYLAMQVSSMKELGPGKIDVLFIPE
jgi:hypothetical protein